MWLDLTGTIHNLVWRHPWPADTTAELVLLTNLNGTVTNSDPELSALVLEEATLLEEVPKACMDAPRSGYDNTPTKSREASMINPVVAELLCIHALHSRKFS